MPNPKAVVLLSGGQDSVTCLAIARAAGYDCYCLSFDYGQKHRAELKAAAAIAKKLGAAQHRIFPLAIGELGGSALTDKELQVPNYQASNAIPSTYVPARNTVFLSIALGWAEVLGARDIFYGASSVDYSGYPDCRPEYMEQFQKLANLATKAGVTEDNSFRIHTPLMYLSKAEMIKKGTALGVDYALTITCYRADEEGRACGSCASCILRKNGFIEAGLTDPTHYL